VLKVFINGSATGSLGTLNADGSFSVDLPVIPDASLTATLSPNTCTSGTFTINPTDGKGGGVTVGVFATANSNTSEGSLTQTEATPSTDTVGAKRTLVARFYVNKDVSIAVNNCVSGTSTINGTWNLKIGYNEIFQTLETISLSPSTTKFNLGMGTDGKPWRIDTSSSQPFSSLIVTQ
jgi:hypothetical protein